MSFIYGWFRNKQTELFILYSDISSFSWKPELGWERPCLSLLRIQMSFQTKLQQEYERETRNSPKVSMVEWMHAKVATVYPNALYCLRVAKMLCALENPSVEDKRFLNRIGLEAVLKAD